MAKTIQAKADRRLIYYLYSEIISTAVIEMSYLVYGVQSRRYSIIYFSMRALELLAASFLAKPRMLGLLIACAFTRLTYAFIEGHVSFDLILLLVEGWAFLFLGFSLGFSVPFRPKPTLYGPIAVMWLLLSIFDLGYAMSLFKSLEWRKLNEYWPSLVCIPVFFWIGWYHKTKDTKNFCK